MDLSLKWNRRAPGNTKFKVLPAFLSNRCQPAALPTPTRRSIASRQSPTVTVSFKFDLDAPVRTEHFADNLARYKNRSFLLHEAIPRTART